MPPTGRTLPGMPLDMNDADRDASSYANGGRFGGQRPDGPRQDWSGRDQLRGPWWRPTSTAGRVFLGLCALIVLGGLATGTFFLKTYLERDGRFRIAGASNIEASGLTQVSRAEMLPVFGEDIGRNIFFVPLRERRKQLEQIPWIEKATVMRLFPDQIRVSVVERQPVAFARQGQQFGLVDANGVLLTMPAATMAQHHYSFPTLTGIDPRDPLPARQARMAVYGRLLQELDSSGQKLSTQISEVDLTDPEDARVTMQDDTTLLHFGEDHFLERYQHYKAHIAEWRQQYPKLTAVDLRYDQQVVLEMAPGSNVAQSTADEQSAAGAKATEDKAPGTVSANKAGGKPSPSNVAASKSGSSKLATGKPATKAKSGKSTGKSPAKTKTPSRSAQRTALNKANEKKRAEARRAALNLSKQKTTPTARPAATAGEGQ
ncbi:MAG: FtsQ-type POTRA domain-containing protein [Terracidiphilus sp.]